MQEPKICEHNRFIIVMEVRPFAYWKAHLRIGKKEPVKLFLERECDSTNDASN